MAADGTSERGEPAPDTPGRDPGGESEGGHEIFKEREAVGKTGREGRKTPTQGKLGPNCNGEVDERTTMKQQGRGPTSPLQAFHGDEIFPL